MSKVYTIGEVAQAHEGSIHLAHQFIDNLADCGIDAVKFQMHISEAESSPYEPFRIPPIYVQESRQEYWKRMEFTPDQWIALKAHCESRNVDFLATPSSLKAIELLEKLDVKKYKVGSADTTNFLLLDRIAQTQKEMIISSGMSTIEELDSMVHFLTDKKAKFSILQCTSAYPTSEMEWNLQMLSFLRCRYQVPIGFSDHSGDLIAPLAAVALGAEILEFHAAFDQKMHGPDSSSSLNIMQISTLIKGIRKIEDGLVAVHKILPDNIKQLKNTFGKSLAINKYLHKGDRIDFEHLECKKPNGLGIPVSEYQSIIGKRLKDDMSQWSFLNYTDLQ